MKIVVWTDERGRKRRSVVPDTVDPTMAKFGIPAGPPDLDQMDWEAIKMELNNYLAENGLWSWEEVQQGAGVVPAMNILKKHLIALYREEWKNKTKNGIGG